MSKSKRTLVLWVVLVLMFWAIYQVISTDQNASRRWVRFGDMIEAAEAGELRSLSIKVRDDGVATILAHRGTEALYAEGVLSAEYFDRIDRADVAYSFAPSEGGGFWQSILITWLPMIFLLAVVFFFLRQVQGGGGKNQIAEMKTAKTAPTLVDGRAVTFNDIVGAEEAKTALRSMAAFLSSRLKDQRPPPGLIIAGPPGTGKSFLIDALAAETKLTVFAIRAPELVEIFVGVGAARVRDVFKRAKEAAPAIIAIDAIDAIAFHRSRFDNNSKSEVEQTLYQVLASMSEVEAKKIAVAVVATTDRPDLLDNALIDSGRFGRMVTIALPTEAERETLLKKMSAGVALDPAVDPALLAATTEGMSPGQIRAAIDQAVLYSGSGQRVGAAELRRAIDELRAARVASS